MKKVYIDVCALCRPFDDQSYIRVKLETDATFIILEYVRSGRFKMMVSPVHYKEINGIKDIFEKNELLILLDHLGHRIKTSAKILKDLRNRAEDLVKLGFGIADAAHLAFAEKFSDYFITCDDKIVRKGRELRTSLIILSPVEFYIMEELA
jgi:hypothetical protein